MIIIDFFRSLLYKSKYEKTLTYTVEQLSPDNPYISKIIKFFAYCSISIAMSYIILAPIRLLIPNTYMPSLFSHNITLTLPIILNMLAVNLFLDIVLYPIVDYIHTHTTWLFTSKCLIIMIRTHLYSTISTLCFILINFLLSL